MTKTRQVQVGVVIFSRNPVRELKTMPRVMISRRGNVDQRDVGGLRWRCVPPRAPPPQLVDPTVLEILFPFSRILSEPSQASNWRGDQVALLNSLPGP